MVPRLIKLLCAPDTKYSYKVVLFQKKVDSSNPLTGTFFCDFFPLSFKTELEELQ